MELRVAVAEFDATTGRYTVYVGSVWSWWIRGDTAVVLGVLAESVHVIARDAGGSRQRSGVRHLSVGTDITVLHQWWRSPGENLRKAPNDRGVTPLELLDHRRIGQRPQLATQRVR